MSTPYVGEVRLVGFNFAPEGWSLCNGSLIGIDQNPTLYQLVGTTYGGNGTTTFALPNLQGRIPIHQGSNGTNTYTMGEMAGTENVTLTVGQYPAHNHSLFGTNGVGSANSPGNNVLGKLANCYDAQPPSHAMNSAVILPYQGGNQPHSNMQPFLVLNWIIAQFGVFPSQS